MKKIDLFVEVVRRDETRIFKKDGNTGRYLTFQLRDETGEIQGILFEDGIDKYEHLIVEGHKVCVKNCYVYLYQYDDQTTLQVRTGRNGCVTPLNEVVM